MEYLVAFLALMTTVIFAVVIALNIEKGKSWALEIAQAVSVLDPYSPDFVLQNRETFASPAAPVSRSDAGVVKKADPEGERLAA